MLHSQAILPLLMQLLMQQHYKPLSESNIIFVYTTVGSLCSTLHLDWLVVFFGMVHHGLLWFAHSIDAELNRINGLV